MYIILFVIRNQITLTKNTILVWSTLSACLADNRLHTYKHANISIFADFFPSITHNYL